MKILDCKSTLIGLFSHEGKPSGVIFQEAARLILKSPTKSVDLELFKNTDLSSPAGAAIVLKQFHGLLFHIPSQSYRFYSKCHETAASQMKDLN